MKRLYLVRHAQALPAGDSDKERPLSAKGKKDSQALGRAMNKKGYIPSLALCSNATRTRETLSGILNITGAVATLYEEALYNASEESLLKRIQTENDNIKSLLIVGHNPTIHALAARLVLDDGCMFVNRLSMHYTPGTISVFDIACDSWSKIQPHNNKIIDLMDPLDYNATSRPAGWR